MLSKLAEHKISILLRKLFNILRNCFKDASEFENFYWDAIVQTFCPEHLEDDSERLTVDKEGFYIGYRITPEEWRDIYDITSEIIDGINMDLFENNKPIYPGLIGHVIFSRDIWSESDFIYDPTNEILYDDDIYNKQIPMDDVIYRIIRRLYKVIDRLIRIQEYIAVFPLIEESPTQNAITIGSSILIVQNNYSDEDIKKLLRTFLSQKKIEGIKKSDLIKRIGQISKQKGAIVVHYYASESTKEEVAQKIINSIVIIRKIINENEGKSAKNMLDEFIEGFKFSKDITNTIIF